MLSKCKMNNVELLYESESYSHFICVYKIGIPTPNVGLQTYKVRVDISKSKQKDSRLYLFNADHRWSILIEDNYHEGRNPGGVELTAEQRMQNRQVKLQFYFNCFYKLIVE